MILKELCEANNVGMISHRNINPKRHLNRSRLQLNDAGVSLFNSNFRDLLIILIRFNSKISIT